MDAIRTKNKGKETKHETKLNETVGKIKKVLIEKPRDGKKYGRKNGHLSYRITSEQGNEAIKEFLTLLSPELLKKVFVIGDNKTGGPPSEAPIKL